MDAAEAAASETQVGRCVEPQGAQAGRAFVRFRRVPVNYQDTRHRTTRHRTTATDYARTTPVTGSRRLRI